MKDIGALLTLPFDISPKEKGHHPISKGQSPVFYRLDDLSDSGTGEGPFVLGFEKYLVAMFWRLGCPIPYAFRTKDGEIRSLDAGCIKWLNNRTPAEITIHYDSDGYIGAVQPLLPMLAKHHGERDNIISQCLILPV